MSEQTVSGFDYAMHIRRTKPRSRAGIEKRRQMILNLLQALYKNGKDLETFQIRSGVSDRAFGRWNMYFLIITAMRLLEQTGYNHLMLDPLDYEIDDFIGRTKEEPLISLVLSIFKERPDLIQQYC